MRSIFIVSLAAVILPLLTGTLCIFVMGGFASTDPITIGLTYVSVLAVSCRVVSQLKKIDK